MPLKYPGSTILLTNSSPSWSSVFYISGIRFRVYSEPFERAEFTAARLREVVNPNDGSLPVYSPLDGGRIVQYFTNCNANERLRPAPIDTPNLDNIFWRFDVTEFQIDLAPSDINSSVNLFNLSQKHVAILAQFGYRQRISARANIDYDTLVGMQSDNLSTLTSTGLSMTSRTLPFSVVNLLCVSVETDIDYAIKGLDGTSTTVYSGGRMTLQNRVIVPESHSTF